jgi:hypothetical protein
LKVLKGGVGSSQNQLRSTSFVLRKITQHIIKNFPQALTKEIQDEIVAYAIKGRVTEAEYLELLRDLIKHNNYELGHVFNNKFKPIFDYSIYSINCLTNNPTASVTKSSSPTRGSSQNPLGRIHGKQLDDLISALKLQRTLTDSSEPYAKQIVTTHM